MPNCTQVRDELKAFADGELHNDQRSRVRGHLDDCADCRTELAAIQRLGDELRILDTAAPEPELHARILRSIPAQSAPRAAAPMSSWRRLRLPAMAMAGATVAAAVIMVITLKGGGLKNVPALAPPDGAREAPEAAASTPAKSEAMKAGPEVFRKSARSPETATRALRPPGGDSGASQSLSGAASPPGVERHDESQLRTSSTRADLPAQSGEIMPKAAGPGTPLRKESGAPAFAAPKAGASRPPAPPSGLGTKIPAVAQNAAVPAARQSVEQLRAPADSVMRKEDAVELHRQLSAGKSNSLAEKDRRAHSPGAAAEMPVAPQPGSTLSVQAEPHPDLTLGLVLTGEQLEKATAEVVNLARQEGGYVSPITRMAAGADQGVAYLTTILPRDRIESLKEKLVRAGMEVQAEPTERWAYQGVGPANRGSANQQLNYYALGQQNAVPGQAGTGGLGGGLGGVPGGRIAGGSASAEKGRFQEKSAVDKNLFDKSAPDKYALDNLGAGRKEQRPGRVQTQAKPQRGGAKPDATKGQSRNLGTMRANKKNSGQDGIRAGAKQNRATASAQRAYGERGESLKQRSNLEREGSRATQGVRLRGASGDRSPLARLLIQIREAPKPAPKK